MVIMLLGWLFRGHRNTNRCHLFPLSTNGRPGREAAQFPPTNIATVELLTVVTSFLAPTPTPPELRQIRPLWLKLKYFTQFMNKNNLITRYNSQVLNHFSARDL